MAANGVLNKLSLATGIDYISRGTPAGDVLKGKKTVHVYLGIDPVAMEIGI